MLQSRNILLDFYKIYLYNFTYTNTGFTFINYDYSSIKH